MCFRKDYLTDMDAQRLHERVKRSYLAYRNEFRPELSRRIGPVKGTAEKEVATWGKGWISMPWKRRLWLWRRGFMSRSDVLYGIDDDAEYERYLSDYERQRTAYINGDRSVALDNKLVFHWMLQSFDEHRVDTYGLIADGRFHDANGLRPMTDGATATTVAVADESPEPMDASEWVTRRLRAQGSLVLKPVGGSGGQGVRFCSFEDGRFRVGGEELTAPEFQSMIAGLDEYLVTEEVEQADYADELYPGATNTIRVLTMYDPVADEPFVPVAVHRIGTDESAPVDNFSGGGLTAEVDRDTGELSEAVSYPYTGRLRWHESHPDTDARIEGTRVTGWPEIREEILDMADAFSHTPYIGWDVAVTGDGEFAVIEANNCSDVNLLQIHRPLLDDPRARRFYAYHDVI